jgi:hypothetical protein
MTDEITPKVSIVRNSALRALAADSEALLEIASLGPYREHGIEAAQRGSVTF